ncbi:MAG: isochorismate synthase [Bradymonadia bacterium]
MNQAVAQIADAFPISRLLAEIEHVEANGGGVVRGTLPARIDAFTVLSALDDDAVYWRDDSEEALGLGVAAEFVSSGAGRFHELALAAEAFAVQAYPDDDDLRFFCGFSFDPAVRSSRWRDFGAARAVLPRVLLQRPNRASEWAITIPIGDESPVASVRPILLNLGAAESVAARQTREAGRRTSANFMALVRDAKERITLKHAAKIVAARRVDLELTEAVDVGRVARALDAQNPGCHRFLFRRGGATFVGASPERLIRREDDHVSTVALAGSAAPEDAESLLQSLKDHDEHEHVVRHVREALRPFCDDVHGSVTPSLRPLNHVVHLETPFDATLREPVHVLRLAAALHPTPAVGGVPSQFATGWIRELEGADRGWYAGPIGWFNAAGDGELAVAIRSALLRGRDVALWSGAGIVAESDPHSESEEADRKLRPILTALGLS